VLIPWCAVLSIYLPLTGRHCCRIFEEVVPLSLPPLSQVWFLDRAIPARFRGVVDAFFSFPPSFYPPAHNWWAHTDIFAFLLWFASLCVSRSATPCSGPLFGYFSESICPPYPEPEVGVAEISNPISPTPMRLYFPRPRIHRSGAPSVLDDIRLRFFLWS